MAWEHINQIFPQGYAITTNGNIPNMEIKERNLKSVSCMRNYASRNMFHKQEEWIWHSDGRFEVQTTFDALNLIPHVNNIIPLNIYGGLMLNDYLTTHQC